MFVCRDAIPPVSDRVESLYNSVEDTVTDHIIPAVEPYAYRFGKTLQNDVGPAVQSAVKTSLNAVFTGVPKVINQVSTIHYLNFAISLNFSALNALLTNF